MQTKLYIVCGQNLNNHIEDYKQVDEIIRFAL